MFDSVVCQISEEFAEGFGSVEGMAAYQLLDFEKPQIHVGYVTCYAHVTERNKVA